MSQSIRLSQFVVTYGPGAILEGTEGPRAIPLPDIGLFDPNQNLNPPLSLQALEISDQRMSAGLLNNARIFRLPSNAELGLGDGWYLYRTRPFPSYSLCLNTGGHNGRFGVLYQAAACSLCGVQGRRRQQTIRFVRACPEGHLDDVDWHMVVHPPHSPCVNRQWFRWHGIGGALNDIRIECPACGVAQTLGYAYARPWPCGGRFPEREPLNAAPARAGCPAQSRIMQRQASNLRVPQLLTLFTIPPRSTQLHNLLQVSAVRGALAVISAQGQLTEAAFLQALSALALGGMIGPAIEREIRRHPWLEVADAIRDVLTPVRAGFRDLLLEELEALLHASVHGAPPQPGPRRVARPIFEVNQQLVRTFQGPGGQQLRITPISRLRTVTVQTAYRREVPRSPGGANAPARPVSVAFRDATNLEWLPGVELLGEGVFVTLDADDGWHFPLQGEEVRNWTDVSQNPGNDYPPHLFRVGPQEEMNPCFVWWHTFSHLLLRSVSMDAGYSSSSIRERVLIQKDDQRGVVRGGVVLYATQPGSDGTMGGLIALVPHFQAIIDRAIDQARSCSNDPLCSDQRFEAGKYSGSSCYSCLLASETSCEHRNLWLDRTLFLNNLP